MNGVMSAGMVLQRAVVDHLGGAGIAGLRVFDAPPVRGSVPHAVVEEPMLGAVDAAGVVGRVGTIAITYRDAGERPVRLRGLVGAVEDAMAMLPAELGGGWRLVGLRLARSRITAAKPVSGQDRWLAMSEFAVRVFRADS